jgi:hypothetical protein
MKYFFQGGKVLDRGCKHDTIELLIAQYPGSDFSLYEMQVRIVAEDPGSLLQLREIDIQAGHFRAGDLRQLVGQPAVPATYFQDIEVLAFISQVVHQPVAGPFPNLPFLVVGMTGGDIGQLHQFFIGVEPILYAPGDDVFFFEQDVPGRCVARNLYVSQDGRVR